MSRIAIVVLMLGVLCAVGFAQIDTCWSRHYQGSVSFPHQYMSLNRTLAVDDHGNSYVCSYGNHKSYDYGYLVQKYDPDGKLLWAEAYCDGGYNAAAAIAVDKAGGVYVTGHSSKDRSRIMTVKWSSSGSRLWVRYVAGNASDGGNAGYAIAVYGGGVYVAGYVSNTGSGQDFALIRLDATTGSLDWLRTISRCGGNGYYEQAKDVCVDPTTGAVYAVGRTHHGSDGYEAAFARYDAAGHQVWVKNYNYAPGSDERLDAVCIADERVAATGQVMQAGLVDALVLSYPAGGGAGWAAVWDGPGHGADYGSDIASDGAGNCFVAGAGSNSTSTDMLLLKYNPAGSLLWSRLRGGNRTDRAFCVAVDSYGSAVIGGRRNEMRGDSLAIHKYGADGTPGGSFVYQPKPGLSGNYCSDIAFFGEFIYASGLTYWGYPLYNDPTVLKLKEIPDVGIHALLTPVGTVPLGTVVTPRAQVRNYSLLPANVTCVFRITDGYEEDSAFFIPGNSTVTVDFPTWTAGLHGHWVVECYSTLAQDYDRGNDTAATVVYVPGPSVDVGVRELVEPHGDVRYQSSLIPTATWHNFGTAPVDAWVFMFIDLNGVHVYADSLLLSGFAPDGYDSTVQFRPWIATQAGHMVARCSTWIAGDEISTNDTLSFGFTVANMPLGHWTRMPDVPYAPSGRTVYYGGGLAADDTTLYVLKGYKTLDAYGFSLAGGTWRTLDSIPRGVSGRPISKGGAIVTDGYGRLFVVKGYKTLEFYRHDPVLGWTGLSDIPPGPSGRAPKYGTGLEYVELNDTGYIYYLKGSNKDEFFRYSILADSWEELPCAPAGNSGKTKYKKGSGLVSDGEGRIYCLKSYYNELFAFDVASGEWLPGQLPNLPFYGSTGRKKKAKQGASMTWADGELTLIKGGNTREFWRLDAADSTWLEFPEVPYAERRRKVKYGAGLEYVAGSYYVSKGSKTCEMWRFDLFDGGEDGGVMAGVSLPLRLHRMDIAPNPVVGRTVACLPGCPPGPIRLALYDAAGRIRFSEMRTVTDGRLALDLRHVAPGVYFLVASADGVDVGAKVVVTR